MTTKILLADDEQGILELLAATLGSDDRYTLLLARDGEEALRIARSERPDLFLLDILMPKMDGFQVCRALRDDPINAGIKIIMLTALAQPADRARAIEVGADDYFTKPFSPTELLEKVEAVLS